MDATSLYRRWNMLKNKTPFRNFNKDHSHILYSQVASQTKQITLPLVLILKQVCCITALEQNPYEADIILIIINYAPYQHLCPVH